jgi:hypothetical protein
MHWSPLITHVAKLFRANASGMASGRKEKLHMQKAELRRLFFRMFRFARALSLLPDHFHQHTLSATAIEFAIKNLFPWANIQLPFGNRDDHFSSHELPLDMRIAIVFTRAVVAIRRLLWRHLFQEFIVISEQPRLVIIDIDTRGDMHGIHEDKPFRHTTLSDSRFNLRRNIDVGTSGACFEPEFFAVGLHATLIGCLHSASA